MRDSEGTKINPGDILVSSQAPTIPVLKYIGDDYFTKIRDDYFTEIGDSQQFRISERDMFTSCWIKIADHMETGIDLEKEVQDCLKDIKC